MNSNPDQETKPTQSDVEFEALGYYEPGFIHLRVNTDEDLSHLTQPEVSHSCAWFSTFLHEYVHFLQDITTTQGLLNFIHAVEYLKNAIKQVNDTGSNCFTVPLKVSNEFNWHTNKKLKEIYRGREGEARSIRYLGYRSSPENVANSKSEAIDVVKYFADYYDNDAQTKMSCHFGSIHLKEYMAHVVQTRFDPAKIHDELPYCLVELIIQSEVPSIAQTPELIVALCDASLMHYHPAQLFFHSIERMKRNSGLIPGDVESIYNFVYEGVMLESGDSFDSLYLKTAEQALSHFRDSLKGDVFKSNVLWFEELIRAATDLRHKQRGFFSRFVSSPGILSQEFGEVLNALGIPFTTNAHSKGYFFPPASLRHLEVQPFYPKVFQAIWKTFAGSAPCSMHPFCETASNPKITSADCHNQPWERVNFPELCPYAQIWRTWGLEGRIPS